MNNCTLSGNVGATAGGGASACFLTNCVLTNNSAQYGNGGGASGGTLSGCLVIANAADNNHGGLGGGTYNSTVLNCTLSANTCIVSGGGAYGGYLSNCLLVSNVLFGGSGGGVGGGAVLDSCTLTGNRARDGGGADDATLNDCSLIANQAFDGGGAFSCIWCGGAPISTFLNNCTLIGNSASDGGGGAAGCYLNGCLLASNWMATYNDSGTGGGAVYGCTVTNCVLLTNWTVALGGGALDSDLYNCTLEGNAAWYGGGAVGSDLVNCALIGNSASSAGAVGGCTLTNCTVAHNSAGWEGAARGCTLWNCISYFNGTSNYDTSSVLNDCCTTPLPPGGFDNITNDPAFVDLAGGDFHLRSDSPCINSGNNAYASGTNDLDGNPRVVGGTVDIGAYEYQSPTSVISYAWLQQYGLPTDGSADFIDSDGDGMNNWQEWVAGTDPLDPSSVLKMHPPAKTPPGALLTWNSDAAHTYFIQRASSPASLLNAVAISTNVPGLIGTSRFLDSDAPRIAAAFYRVGTSTINAPTPIVVQPPAFIPASVLVTWTSVTNRSYLLQRSTNLSRPPGFVTIQSNLAGQAGTTSFMDTNASGAGPYLYRVVVQR